MLVDHTEEGYHTAQSHKMVGGHKVGNRTENKALEVVLMAERVWDRVQRIYCQHQWDNQHPYPDGHISPTRLLK